MTGDMIKKLRLTLELNQKDFGERFGASRDMVANMETGRVEVKDFISRHIISVFNLREEWAQTGEGEMFAESGDGFDEVARQLNLNEFQRHLVQIIYEMPIEHQRIIRDYAVRLAADDVAARGAPEETEHERIERVANEYLDAYEAQQDIQTTDKHA